MADTLTLEVVTPQARVFDGDVESVMAPGFHGDITVLPEHEPYVTAMRAGVLRFDHGGSGHHYVIGAGFAEVGPDKVILLTDLCEAVAGLDAAVAEAKLAEDETILGEVDPTDPRHLDARADYDLQLARIRAAGERG
jgi:F-type H+-transporting ATPase subunit epsilon